MRKNGFTLVEILVVMVVVGILIALVIPNALKAIDIANVRSCANNVRTLDSAIQLYYADTRKWPANAPAGMDALCPYLDAAACNPAGTQMILKCPVNGSSYSFLPDANKNNSSINRGAHFDTFPNDHN